MNQFDHPIFLKSIRFIRNQLGSSGLEPLQQDVLERLIHTTGDFSIQSLLRFTPNACEIGIEAMKKGAPVLTDTKMASVAIASMNSRTYNLPLFNILDWAPPLAPKGSTRSSIGMKNAWLELNKKYSDSPSPIVLIGSAPTALVKILDLVKTGSKAPSLIIGMPVGFVGVIESKSKLSSSHLNYILLEGNKGGAAMVAATFNSLLRSSLN